MSSTFLLISIIDASRGVQKWPQNHQQGNHIITPSSKAAPKEIVVCIIVSADEEAISSRALAAVLNWNGTQSMLAKMDVPNAVPLSRSRSCFPGGQLGPLQSIVMRVDL
jgi:hypothetical protein